MQVKCLTLAQKVFVITIMCQVLERLQQGTIVP